ncbi:YqhA family protein [Paucibacter sp. B2R-40]|uniref:YqhA family protein n=1 Tax=Paucibacter sp. B2R-40 TaxID=2893554 RepID=UPI0021E3B101|nr:YqhA family protein [Paucibacter sp. B2R-40]MCV2353341.1 YqhA family protein [Paucibacter sp. B2R-40]
MMKILNASRFLVLAAVIGSLLSAVALYAYGLIDTMAVIARTLGSAEVSTKGAKGLMLYFIEIFDLFLLGTVMLILALGLYELFINPELKMASRLQINTFEDLKTTLVTVVIAVMAVTFLGQIMSWTGDASLFDIGVPVALVILALNLYLWVAKGAKK